MKWHLGLSLSLFHIHKHTQTALLVESGHEVSQQSGDGTKELDQELKLLLGVLPLSPDLLLREDSKSSRNLKSQETCGAREGLEHKR